MKARKNASGKKISLLDLLCRQYPSETREQLRSYVLTGDVFVNGERVREPGRSITADAAVAFSRPRYVSRGGLKLEHAVQSWQLPVAGRVFLDAGASTGGFTDCLLQHGARYVHAVDVGYNQLAYRLRRDVRVGVQERSNIMTMQRPEPAPDAAVADLAFRSAIGAARRLLEMAEEHWMVALVKPQFEIASDTPDFDGVVRSVEQLAETLDTVASRLDAAGIFTRAATESPIHGRRGNREFLLLLSMQARTDALESVGLPDPVGAFSPLTPRQLVQACIDP